MPPLHQVPPAATTISHDWIYEDNYDISSFHIDNNFIKDVYLLHFLLIISQYINKYDDYNVTIFTIIKWNDIDLMPNTSVVNTQFK